MCFRVYNTSHCMQGDCCISNITKQISMVLSNKLYKVPIWTIAIWFFGNSHNAITSLWLQMISLPKLESFDSLNIDIIAFNFLTHFWCCLLKLFSSCCFILIPFHIVACSPRASIFLGSHAQCWLIISQVIGFIMNNLNRATLWTSSWVKFVPLKTSHNFHQHGQNWFHATLNIVQAKENLF
jgi:hypothetical protein